jgi:hypothetical protein
VTRRPTQGWPKTWPKGSANRQIACSLPSLAGFEPVSEGKTPSKTVRLGPSGPTDAPDRYVSHRPSWAKNEARTAALRAALEAAITGGRTADAGRLATILASGVRTVRDSNVMPSKTRRRH